MNNKNNIQPQNKYLLPIEEAAQYFGIGEKKLRKIITENLDSGLVIQNGVKYLIKRQQFEAFLNNVTSI
ncbi:MAG: helix-turn-helix domain-containing protein [Lachnospiraceae bacterium]|jgi:excisionase family DNA binding protein|nr:helix-turn-helix domain-containing protein [Lachnospiraceae bacterium]